MRVTPGVWHEQWRNCPFTEMKMQEEVGSLVWKARERKEGHRLGLAGYKVLLSIRVGLGV